MPRTRNSKTVTAIDFRFRDSVRSRVKCASLSCSAATSSRTIHETDEEFRAVAGTVQLGRKLITKDNRRELTDKLLLLLATVLYILKKRLLPFL